MRYIVILITFLCIGSLSAKVYDSAPLVPQPQIFKITSKARYKIPAMVSIYADQDMHSEIPFVQEALQKTKKAVQTQIIQNPQNASIRLLLNNKTVPRHPEGYRMDIDKTGITIYSRNKRGIFFGIQTMKNMLMNSTENSLPFVSITDYPSLEKRWGNIHMPDLKSKHLPDVKRLIDLFASLKYNGLIFNLFEGFPYSDLGLPKAGITQAQLSELAEYCRARHLELIPGLQMLSHVRWLRKHPKYLEFIENPKEAPNWGVNWCPNHPEVRQLWQKALDEHIRIFKPRYFFLFMDEIMQGSLGFCPRCKGKDPNKLVLEEFQRYYAFLKARNVIPIICHDTFLDRAKSNVFYAHLPIIQGEKIRKSFPRNTIMQYWGYGTELDTPCLQDLTADGFRILGGAWSSCFGNAPAMARAMLSLGNKSIGAVMFAWYYYSVAPEGGLHKYGYRTWPGIVLGGHCFWNPKTENIPLTTLNFDPVYEARRRLNGTPLPVNTKWTPLSITSSINTDLAQEWCFPVFTQEGITRVAKDYNSLPEKFTLNIDKQKGILRAVTLSGNQKGTDNLPTGVVKIPLGDIKTSGLSFLLSALPTANFEFDNNEWHSYGGFNKPRFGTLRITYKDGKKMDIALQYLLNITSWNAQAAGFGCRFGAVHHDKQGRLMHLSILTWKNPRPQQPISSVTLMSRYVYNRALALYAVSAADMTNNMIADGVLPEKRKQGQAKRNTADGKVEPIKDSDVSAGIFNSVNMHSLHGEIITSPWDKNKKAISFKGRAKAPFGRVMFDIPIKVPEYASGFGFRCKISNPAVMNDGAFYLMDQEAAKATGVWVQPLRKPFQKEQFVIAEHQTMLRENALIRHHAAKFMRISFRMNPTHENIEIICEIPQWYQYPPVNILWHKTIGERNLNP